MEKTTAARLDPRAVLAAVGPVFVVAVIWAATALASGGTSGAPELASGTGGSTPSSVFVQSSDDPAPSADDCPERGGGGNSSEPGGSGTSGNTL